jgi:TRAP-type C4-dicarboxylate transport system substrate-binding protein
MQRRSFLKASAAGAGLALAAPAVLLHAAPLTLRFAHFAQEDHPANIAAKQFAARVETRSKGEIKINIFPNNVLGGPSTWACPPRDSSINTTPPLRP